MVGATAFSEAKIYKIITYFLFVRNSTLCYGAMRFIQNFSVHDRFAGNGLQDQGWAVTRSLRSEGGRLGHSGSTSCPASHQDTMPLSPIASEFLSKLMEPNVTCMSPQCFLLSLASEGGLDSVWGVRKGSLEQPDLGRRGQEKPKLEALLHQSPWRKASHPVGGSSRCQHSTRLQMMPVMLAS